MSPRRALRIATGTHPTTNAVLHPDFETLFFGYDKQFVYLPTYDDVPRQSPIDGRWAGVLGAIDNDTVDTDNAHFFMTPERIDAFWMSNPTKYSEWVALYTHLHDTAVNFESLSARMGLDVYALVAVAILLLLMVNAAIDTVRPNRQMSQWYALVAAVPFFNAQAPFMQVSSATNRMVQITIGVLVLLTTSFYQTSLPLRMNSLSFTFTCSFTILHKSSTQRCTF